MQAVQNRYTTAQLLTQFVCVSAGAIAVACCSFIAINALTERQRIRTALHMSVSDCAAFRQIDPRQARALGRWMELDDATLDKARDMQAIACAPL